MKKTNEPVDGRANPTQFDETKVTDFRKECGVKAQDKRLAAETTSTPVRHQSGKGLKAMRENWRGYSKVGVIRFCAAQGFDPAKARAFVAKAFKKMTDEVFGRAWREGLAGQSPDIDRETMAIIRRYCR